MIRFVFADRDCEFTYLN